MNRRYDDLRAALRERVRIADLLQARGVPVRLNGRGGGTALCPFHDDHRPPPSVYRSHRDGTERFRCWSCGSRGDVFDFVQTLLDYADHTATLRALAAEHNLPWPEHHEPPSSDVLDRAAQFYAGRLTAPVLRYLADRGFPEPFVRQRRIGYAPVSSTRDLLVRQIRSTAGSNGTQFFQEAIEAGLVVRDKVGHVRDFFATETHGYIVFPNVVHGHVVDLQGRAYPTPARRSAYLNRPGPISHLYNAGDAGLRSVIFMRRHSGRAVCARLQSPGHGGVRALRHRRLAVSVAVVVPTSEPGVRRAGSRRDRSGHYARASVWDPRPCSHSHGGTRAQRRSQ